MPSQESCSADTTYNMKLLVRNKANSSLSMGLVDGVHFPWMATHLARQALTGVQAKCHHVQHLHHRSGP